MDFNNMKDFGFEDLNVRKSVFDMQVITLDTPYLGGLPPELEKFHYYFSHEGHVLMVIPRNYLKIALESGDLDDYEISQGFYTDIHTWPFPLAENNQELLDNILCFDQNLYLHAIQKHHQDLHSFEHGTACQQVLNYIKKTS